MFFFLLTDVTLVLMLLFRQQLVAVLYFLWSYTCLCEGVYTLFLIAHT